jgi:outer membrane protein assembly factor BamB
MSLDSQNPDSLDGESSEPARETSRPASVSVLDILLTLLLLCIIVGTATARAKAEVIGFAEANVLTLLAVVLGVLIVVLRLLFSNRVSRQARRIAVALMLGAVVALPFLVRIDRVSGHLIPVLRWAWTKKPDQLLETLPPQTESHRVDLSVTTADDFPQFLGPNRDLHVPNVQLATDWNANPPRELWRRPIGAGWSGFSASNGYAITMEQRDEDELVTCYEIASGEVCWSHGIQTRHETVLGGTGPRCTPTIHAGRVYTQGATGNVRCLDGENGQLIWSDEILERYGVTAEEDLAAVAWGRSASPLIVDDMLVVPCGGPVEGPFVSLIAYDKDTGEVRWQGGDRQVSYSSPTLTSLAGVRQILSVNEDNVSAHRPEDGSVLWTAPWKGQSNAGASVSQPVSLPDDHVLLTKAYGGGAKLLRIMQNDAGNLVAELVWAKSRLLKTKFTNIVVFDRYAFGLSDGILECVEWPTGRSCWKDRRKGRFGHGQLLRVGELLLVQAEDGEVVLLQPSPQQLIELGRFRALSDQCWNNMCLYGGKYLLVRNAVEAACFELSLSNTTSSTL